MFLPLSTFSCLPTIVFKFHLVEVLVHPFVLIHLILKQQSYRKIAVSLEQAKMLIAVLLTDFCI